MKSFGRDYAHTLRRSLRRGTSPERSVLERKISHSRRFVPFHERVRSFCPLLGTSSTRFYRKCLAGRHHHPTATQKRPFSALAAAPHMTNVSNVDEGVMPFANSTYRRLLNELRPNLLIHLSRSRHVEQEQSANEEDLDDACMAVFRRLEEAGKDIKLIPLGEMLQECISEINTRIKQAEEEISSTVGEWGSDWQNYTQKVDQFGPMNQKKTIEVLQTLSPELLTKMMKTSEDKKFFGEQLQLETDAMRKAFERYNKVTTDLKSHGKAANLRPAQKMLAAWFAPLVRGMEAELKSIEDAEYATDRLVYGPYLKKLNAKELACITMHEALNSLLVTPQVRFPVLADQIGSAINTEANLKELKNHKDVWKKMWADKRLKGVNAMNTPIINANAKRLSPELMWDQRTRIKVGAAMLKVLLDTAYMPIQEWAPDPVPAFMHKYKYQTEMGQVKKLGMIMVHPLVHKAFDIGPDMLDHLNPRFLPMITTPLPWTEINEGGYLSVIHKVMRTRGVWEQTRTLKEADQRGQLNTLYEALNFLGEQAWIVNNKVLNVVNHVWESGGGRADLPSRQDIPLPPRPLVNNVDPENKPIWIQYRAKLKEVEQANADLHSQRCDVSYKIKVAQDFNSKIFYFPFNIDFRGRAYPIPPHLNHIGSDLCRGLLAFGKGLPLGPTGMRWLKIHCANVFGNDKLSFDDRIRWVESKIDDVMAVADDPMCQHTHKDKEIWWMEAENPWQFLATCFELAAALRSPNPEEYVSHMPVHQDGSCNGLQHYAALGKDKWGGQAVNLINADEDKPQDVYSEVCEQVNSIMAEHAAAGDEIAQLLLGNVNRKIIKQTVMTSVYGVTFLGARRQIQNRLEERPDIPFAEPRKQHIEMASAYLARVVLTSLADLFTGARKIMAWLGACARAVAQVGQPMSWVTPIGLPVVQPYRRAKKLNVRTTLQLVALTPSRVDNYPIAIPRQKAAFPPNFVHSLDATHMLLTALDCKEKGLTFSSVHDSFWTHAGTMDQLSASLRDQFVHLYSQPILEELEKSLYLRFPDIDFPPLPTRGELEIDQVRDSKYFFN